MQVNVGMRGTGTIAVMVLAVAIGVVGLYSPGMMATQPSVGATPAGSPVARPMATPIVSSDATPAASPVASPMATTGIGEIIVDPASTRFPVAGNAFHLLDPGTPGKLSIVAHGPTAGAGQIPVVVRNNTTGPLTNVSVGAEARDISGALIGVGTSGSYFLPIVEPGALAMSMIFFNPPLPDGATVTFYPEGNSDSSFLQVYVKHSGVELTEFSAASGLPIGTVRNTGEAPIANISLQIACFDGSGTLAGFLLSTPIRQTLGPGEASAFKAGTILPTEPPPCNYFLLTGYGS